MANNQVVATVDELSKAEGFAKLLRDFMDFSKDTKAWKEGSSELAEAQEKIKRAKEIETQEKDLLQHEAYLTEMGEKIDSAKNALDAREASLKQSEEDIAAREASISPKEKELTSREAALKKEEVANQTLKASLEKQRDKLDAQELEAQENISRIKELEAENASLTSKIDGLRGHLE